MKLLSKILLFSISRIYETTFACSLENCDLQVDDNGSNVSFVSRLSKLVFTMPVQLNYYIALIFIFYCINFSTLISWICFLIEIVFKITCGFWLP